MDPRSPLSLALLRMSAPLLEITITTSNLNDVSRSLNHLSRPFGCPEKVVVLMPLLPGSGIDLW